MYCLSVSHKTSNVVVRKKLAFPDEQKKTFLDELYYSENISECLILCTCNRTEVYFCGDESSVKTVETVLSDFSGIDFDELKKYICLFYGDRALLHLFRVAGGIESMVIGEDENDPIVYITDLLIHLAGKQLQKKAAEVIEGENLDILIGSRPLNESTDEKQKEAVKSNVLRILKEKYDVEEEDFLSAELEIVPAGKARDCGLDRSMVAAYGQDDRVCAYTSFVAMMEMEAPKRTSCCLLTDKEEIGSVGATGMQSRFFENTVAELLEGMGCYSDLVLRRTLRNCSMLSSDVSAGYDPAYGECFEKKNSAYLGRGIVLNKFTGARGKSGSNDANAEYVAKVRKIFDDNQVAFQTAELGKVDVGGGGTIAYIAALYGMNVIDSGVSVLSMHAPWEVTSKADIYEAKKGYAAFLKYNKQ